MRPGSDVPRWDLGPIYASFDALEWARDKELLVQQSAALEERLRAPFPTDDAGLEAALVSLVSLFNSAGDLAENLSAYASAVYTTDTRQERPLAQINALEELGLPLSRASVAFRRRLAENRDAVLRLCAASAALAPHAFFLRESLDAAARELSVELEDLAADLARSGGDAWSRLHEAIASTAGAPLEPGGEAKTATELRSLAFDPDRSVREKAFRAELSAWKAQEIPLAAALNGVKGTAWTLDKRRGWESALDKAVFQARVSRRTLDSLIGALEESLPAFRRYLKAKARLLGVPSCAFWDLFAPVGDSARKLSWAEASAFVVDRFASFDPGLAAFARHAFESSWIDAEPREGKIGGAYCTGFPLKGDSRILCNFDGSFSSVTTVAHELGHAWHSEQIKDLPRTRASYPMTLAETASIFCETILLESELENAAGQARLGLVEGNLQDSCQVVVDILSRFYFERSVFERRAAGELSAAEFSALMKEAQLATYGDGLDPAELHPYMWAVKGHYYSPDLGFYNFPYAFGLLFALGLYARYRAEGPSFAQAYRAILRSTGSASAEDVAKAAGFDIEGPAFWRDGVSVIVRRVQEFESMVDREIRSAEVKK